jgi:Icc-related predicted phosphoesterase
MKILYTSDLHGNDKLYKELIQLTENESIDAVIIGGDLLPLKGMYNDSLRIQKDYINNNLFNFFSKIKNKTQSPVFIIFGNNEWAASYTSFKELEKDNLCKIIDEKPYSIKEDLFLIGYPYVPPTPFSPKDFEKMDKRGDLNNHHPHSPMISERGFIETVDQNTHFAKRSTIQEDLAGISNTISIEKTICVMHAPPWNTALDQLHSGEHVGSRSIREFIDNHQPLVTLHGHIHESPSVSNHFWEKINKTISINPGQIHNHLSAVILNTDQPEQSLFHTIYGYVQIRSDQEEGNTL